MQAQTWEDLLFAHWRLDPEVLRPRVPVSLELQTFDGAAWLAITPFRVTGLRVRGLLPIPVLSTFAELNVRTYVNYADKPGIWFFSLDAASPFAVEAARRTYRLPYFRADMSALRRGKEVVYASSRRDGRGHHAVFRGRYEPTGDVFHASPDSLECFLSERYCLYTEHQGRLYRAEIHHPPWPLQPAAVHIEENTMPPPGIELPPDQPLAHFAARQDVVIWPLQDV